MKVGIDARLLTHKVTGIGRYTHELAKGFIELGEEVVLYSPTKIYPDIAKSLNLGANRYSRAYGRFPRMMWSQTMLPKWASEDKVDVFFGPTHRIPYFLKKQIPRVVTIHDLVWVHAPSTMRSFSRLMESLLMPNAIRSSDLIMVDSESTAQNLMELFPGAASKIRLVHLAAGSLPIAGGIETLYILGLRKPYILFVGTIEPRKNLNRLLEAYAKLSPELISRFDLVVVGGRGWGGIDIQAILKNLQIRENVQVLNYVDELTLATLYKYSVFLAMPSLYEGFGLPLLESMSFGRPVLTSNISSMSEISGNAGEYVDPYSVSSISRGMEKLLSDECYVNSLAGLTGGVVSRYSWEISARKAINVLYEAIEIRAQKSK
jgi:glycosyltransferase involved in cell wall biosynthesis